MITPASFTPYDRGPSAQTIQAPVLEDNVSRDNELGIYLWNYGICSPPEDAVQMSGNDVSGNRQEDIRCVEWECGAGEPCVPPSDDGPC